MRILLLPLLLQQGDALTVHSLYVCVLLLLQFRFCFPFTWQWLHSNSFWISLNWCDALIVCVIISLSLSLFLSFDKQFAFVRFFIWKEGMAAQRQITFHCSSSCNKRAWSLFFSLVLHLSRSFFCFWMRKCTLISRLSGVAHIFSLNSLVNENALIRSIWFAFTRTHAHTHAHAHAHACTRTQNVDMVNVKNMSAITLIDEWGFIAHSRLCCLCPSPK